MDSLRPSWKVSEDWEGKAKKQTKKQKKNKKKIPVVGFARRCFYLSSWVSGLIKMNVCLTTGPVSFNVTLVFIFLANIPLSEGGRVYKLPPQTSRVAVDKPLFSLSFICLCLRPSPFLLYALCLALPLLSPKTVISPTSSSCYFTALSFPSSAGLASRGYTS